jgi:hypothetical protein
MSFTIGTRITVYILTLRQKGEICGVNRMDFTLKAKLNAVVRGIERGTAIG